MTTSSDNQTIQSLTRILSNYRTIAMVGLSANWYRPSYFAAKYLLDHGYDVIPVNPNYDEVLGRRCYPSVQAIDRAIDVVDVFQRSDAVPPFADAAIEIGAKVLWLQLGVTHPQAQRKADEAGLEVVADRCMKIEHARIFGGLNFIGVDTGIISAKRPNWLP